MNVQVYVMCVCVSVLVLKKIVGIMDKKFNQEKEILQIKNY